LKDFQSQGIYGCPIITRRDHILKNRLAAWIFLGSLFGNGTVLASDVSQEVTLPHSRTQLVTEHSGAPIGEVTQVGLLIHLDPHWHTYWVNSGDSGAAPRIKYSSSDSDVEFLQSLWPIPHRIESGPLVTFGYEGELLLATEVKFPASLKPGEKVTIQAKGEFLVCEDVCIPARVDLSLSLEAKAATDVQPSSNFQKFQKNRILIPQERKDWKLERQDQNGRVNLSLTWPSGEKGIQAVDFFPFKESGIGNGKLKLKLTSSKSVQIDLPKSDLPIEDPSALGVLIYKRKGSAKLEAAQFGKPKVSSIAQNIDKKKKRASGSLPWILLSAFFGGLLLNFMPCVFPIIWLKLLSLVSSSGTTFKQIRIHNFAYSIGVVTTFLLLAGALILFRLSGEAVGWGFQLQSPWIILSLCFLFVLLALNLLGLFEFKFGDAGLGQKLTEKQGWQGPFYTGVLSVIVAAPCTAPFMGASIGYAVSQPVPIVLLVFSVLGLGLASPFLFFSFVPSAARFLPKPGAWMQHFKELMAFPMLASALWLLWVLSNLIGVNGAFGVAGALLMFSLAVWLKHWGRGGIMLLFSTLLFAVSLILAISQVRGAGQHKLNLSLNSADGVEWVTFTPKALQDFRASGKPIFLDFTAAWCLTCKVNEKITFSDPSVHQLAKDKNLVMMKADWTHSDPEITQLLEQYGRIGVPFYLLFPPSAGSTALVLPEILTPGIFKQFVEKAIP